MPGSPDLLGRSDGLDGLQDQSLGLGELIAGVLIRELIAGGELALGPLDRLVEPLHGEAEGDSLGGRRLDVGVEADPEVGAHATTDDVDRAVARGRRGVGAGGRVDPEHLVDGALGRAEHGRGVGIGRLGAERPLDGLLQMAAVQHEVPGDVDDLRPSLLLLRGGAVEGGTRCVLCGH